MNQNGGRKKREQRCKGVSMREVEKGKERELLLVDILKLIEISYIVIGVIKKM